MVLIVGQSLFTVADPISLARMNPYAVSLEDIRAAAAHIAGWAHRTPVMTCATLDALAGKAIFLKCENLQKVGAFKFRGAYNAVSQLDGARASKGVVTHSSGNHAQALALAARMNNIPAFIVMPRTAPPVKRRAVEGYGGKVYACEPNLAAREAMADAVVAETGGTIIPPFDHPHVIAGQGTIVLEMVEQVERLDAIVAPVGGGGMVAGLCVAARGINPSLRVYAAEPAGADDAARSFAARKHIPQTAPNTIADGLLTSLGQLTWPILRDHLAGVLTVSDDAIRTAMRLCWERTKLVIEPSAAVALAAVLSPQFLGLNDIQRVGVVLSGGNVDLDTFSWKQTV
jgi:threonine dehydratase